MRVLGKAFFLGATLPLAFLVTTAGAQPIIDWGPNCFGYETDYSGHISNAGSELTILGSIDTFFAPFGDLDPNTVEYTFVFDGLVSLGTVVTGGVIFETDYAGGAFRIYADSVGNYDFGVNPPNGTAPSTFEDGELILEGFLQNFHVVLSDFGLPPGATGSFTADWEFTGGSLYDRVVGCYGPMLGNWTDDTDVVTLPAGYTSHTDGKFDLEDCRPTGTEDSSWGSVKRLFR